MQFLQNAKRPHVKLHELKKDTDYYLVFESINGDVDWVRGQLSFAEDEFLTFEINSRYYKRIKSADYNLLEPTGTTSFIFEDIIEAFDYLEYLENLTQTKPLTKEPQ